VDGAHLAAEDAGMPQYRIRVTAPVICSEPIDVTRLTLASRAKRVKLLSPYLVMAVFVRRGDDAVSAAEQAVQELRRALPPGARFATAPAWIARLRRVVVGAGVSGRSELGPDEGDDGLGGVREPRRPMPPTGSTAMALDLPDD
jgi:hypothetical protein